MNTQPQYGAIPRNLDEEVEDRTWWSKYKVFVTFTTLALFVIAGGTAAGYFIRKSFGSNFYSNPSYVSVSPTSASGNPPPKPFRCGPPYPGYPRCAERVQWMQENWNKTTWQEEYYRAKGVDGSLCSFLNYLNEEGLYCPEAADASKDKIRGVNLGGWLVLEPWLTPSLFEQFDPADHVVDQWTFCAKLGHDECRRQLQHHWETWLQEDDLRQLSESGINHVRIPVGYWIMGDIQSNEPWITGDLVYLERALRWAKKYNLNVMLDLHCAPGSQNGFDNSGKMGPIHWPTPVRNQSDGTIRYPNIERTLHVIDQLMTHLSKPEFDGMVKYVELVNEAFITIPLEIVKDFYLKGYDVIRRHLPAGVVIGDSFRFKSWENFMYPPNYKHVYIDTHIYHVFDMWRLSMSTADHIKMTCEQNLRDVAVAPLSTVVGEWSLATTDCAQWLNGYGTGARYEGKFPGSQPIGSCAGHDNAKNTTVYTPEYRQFLREFAEKQMHAYESGSSEGWFFWNFKTERAPEWNYLLGLREGWIPKDLDNREYFCEIPPGVPV